MVSYFAEQLMAVLPEHVQLFSLRYYETVSSYVEWFAADQPTR